MKFIQENEDFLLKTLKDTGKTNLGNFLTSYFDKKAEKERLDAVPKDAMMPQSMLQAAPLVPIVTPTPVAEATKKVEEKAEPEAKKEVMTDLIDNLSSLLQ